MHQPTAGDDLSEIDNSHALMMRRCSIGQQFIEITTMIAFVLILCENQSTINSSTDPCINKCCSNRAPCSTLNKWANNSQRVSPVECQNPRTVYGVSEKNTHKLKKKHVTGVAQSLARSILEGREHKSKPTLLKRAAMHQRAFEDRVSRGC